MKKVYKVWDKSRQKFVKKRQPSGGITFNDEGSTWNSAGALKLAFSEGTLRDLPRKNLAIREYLISLELISTFEGALLPEFLKTQKQKKQTWV